MCGRTACTLSPDEVCQACSVPRAGSDGKKGFVAANWRDHPGGRQYVPSTNIAPSRFTPVIIRNDLKETSESEKGADTNFVIQPMMWGLIPFFFKGTSSKEFNYKTNNCRIEDIDEKNMYKPSLTKGQRCIVLCDGFYEWQTTKADKKNKQPYFIHAPQPKGVELWNRLTWDKEGVWTEEEGWKGPNLLKLAGLYSYWKSSSGEEIYSYTVITMESDEHFGWLHNRVPSILESDADVENWLVNGELDYRKVIAGLKHSHSLEWYPVSSVVNNSRNQDPDCNAPVSLERKETGSSKLMSAWLSKGTASEGSSRTKSVKRESDEKESEAKKPGGGLMKWLKQDKEDE
ncbi:abasic site processing protein HMCES [Oratosquilla oratoria]|uniref:abasic site processing protein HMCES n=1 Tax=Oratosquilla oratoria TaxID=337810 RepID=UPI003F776BCE